MTAVLALLGMVALLFALTSLYQAFFSMRIWVENGQPRVTREWAGRIADMSELQLGLGLLIIGAAFLYFAHRASRQGRPRNGTSGH